MKNMTCRKLFKMVFTPSANDITLHNFFKKFYSIRGSIHNLSSQCRSTTIQVFKHFLHVLQHDLIAICYFYLSKIKYV